MSHPEFRVRDLTVIYDRSSTTAVAGLSLEIAKNSMNFILGRNGCGKSTLLRCLAGHQYWQGGEILRNGESRAQDRTLFNDGLHLISEDTILPDYKVSALKEVYAGIWGHFDDEVFTRIMSLGAIPLDRRPAQVSRGQRIQIQCALSLATRPKVLLIDEATAVLDPFMRNRIIQEIALANQKWGTTVILATNIATELRGVAGGVTIMEAGQVKLASHSNKIGEQFQKLIVKSSDLDQAIAAGFSFLEASEGHAIVVGPKGLEATLKIESKTDRRAIEVDEVFIYFSDRRAA